MKAKKLEAGQMFCKKDMFEKEGKLFVKSKFTNPDFPKRILANRVFFRGFDISISGIETMMDGNSEVIPLNTKD